MQDLNDLMYFAKVVEYAGFSEAARQLGIPKSRLSRRVAALESRIDVQLLQRTSRRITLTGAGQTFYERCRTMVELAQSASEALMQAAAEPQGDLRIGCPITLAQVWLTPLIPGFMTAYPKVRLYVTMTNRRIDPVKDRMDIVLRVKRLPIRDSNQVARKFGEAVDILVAASGLFDSMPRPHEPEELARLPTLSWFGMSAKFTWRLTNQVRTLDVQHEPRLISDDLFALKDAAINGIGIALLPRRICSADLRDKRLEVVLPNWTSPMAHVQAVFTSRRGMTSAARALLDYLDRHPETEDRPQA